jgi:glycosyltransferase involved in cell wall biosynthesis
MDYLSVINNKNISLDIYGGGPQEEVAKQYSQKNHLPVHFFGFVPDAAGLISKYSLCFTSRYLGILEALISKTPVIAQYNNEIKHDYLNLSPFAGFIWQAGNSHEVTAAVNDVLSKSKTVNQRVDSGYNWAKEQTWEKLVNDYRKLWLH